MVARILGVPAAADRQICSAKWEVPAWPATGDWRQEDTGTEAADPSRTPHLSNSA